MLIALFPSDFYNRIFFWKIYGNLRPNRPNGLIFPSDFHNRAFIWKIYGNLHQKHPTGLIFPSDFHKQLHLGKSDGNFHKNQPNYSYKIQTAPFIPCILISSQGGIP